jgi:hypothetical protein
VDVRDIAALYAFIHRRGHRPEFSGPENVEWNTRTADLKVKAVCARCNDGWMEGLDLAAEAVFLTHAVLGHIPLKLNRMSEKETLARWCALVATLLDQATQSTLPNRVHDALYAGDVPEDMQAWIFRTVPPEGKDVAWSATRHLTITAVGRETGVTHVRDVYVATFGIKQFVAQVIQPTEADILGGGLSPQGGGAFMRRIWPAPFTPLIWPPPEALRWEDAMDLPDQIVRQTKSDTA